MRMIVWPHEHTEQSNIQAAAWEGNSKKVILCGNGFTGVSVALAQFYCQAAAAHDGRIAKARIASNTFKHDIVFRFSRVQIEHKLVMFLMLVISVLIYGLSALNLNMHDQVKLEQAHTNLFKQCVGAHV